MVEWARGGARYTRDFDDLTSWLAQQMNQTQITKLMRIGWETVGNIIARVVAEKLPSGRLDALALIGVDEVSDGADHKFLTCVADHERGAIVWATEGRNCASLKAFFDGLTDEQKASIRAVSIDMSVGYENAIRDPDNGLPHAQVCFDPLLVQGALVKRWVHDCEGRTAQGLGGACARSRVWVLCARAPSLTSVHDPRVGSGAGDMMCDGAIPLGEALRPLGLSRPSTRWSRQGPAGSRPRRICVTKGLARTGKVMRAQAPPRRARAACGMSA
jgi:Transposase/Helix-turn-helix domain of transposase family ISL3